MGKTPDSKPVQPGRVGESAHASRSEIYRTTRITFDDLQTRNAALKKVYEDARRIAGTNLTVLIRGESGTGKNLLAQAMHTASRRVLEPFVAVNCSAMTETLLESELFGHEKGAFTGADRDRPGKFEQAKGGTLLLDEVGDLSPAAQAKILRAIEYRQFEGSATPVELAAADGSDDAEEDDVRAPDKDQLVEAGDGAIDPTDLVVDMLGGEVVVE